MRQLVDGDEQLTAAEWKTQVGLPARLTLSDSRTPDGTVKIPGTIREVSAVGVTVDLFFPMLTPRIGATVVLEVMAKTALLQASTVIQNSSSPQRVSLAFPDEVHRIERRQSHRINVAVSATVVDLLRATSHPVTITNISSGGCAVTVPAPLAAGSPVHLDLNAAGLNPTHVEAQVVRCSLSGSAPGQWEIGLSFCNLTEDQRNQLNGYMKLYA